MTSKNILSKSIIPDVENINNLICAILGISDYKRDLSGQLRMNHEMDMYYNIILRYQQLSEVNRRTLLAMLDRLEQAQYEDVASYGKVDVIQKGDDKNAEDSSV